jgi:hypothetical protein
MRMLGWVFGVPTVGMPADQFTENIYHEIDAILPGISGRLSQIGGIPPEIARKILGVMLSSACDATNIGVIVAGRSIIAQLPHAWLKAHLIEVARTTLNLNEEFEFRRLLELLREVQPTLMADVIRDGLGSPDADVRKAAEFHASGVHGPVVGMSQE